MKKTVSFILAALMLATLLFNYFFAYAPIKSFDFTSALRVDPLYSL